MRLLLAILAVGLSGCDPNSQRTEKPTGETFYEFTNVWKYMGRGVAVSRVEVDGTPCILMDGVRTGGISCDWDSHAR